MIQIFQKNSDSLNRKNIPATEANTMPEIAPFKYPLFFTILGPRYALTITPMELAPVIKPILENEMSKILSHSDTKGM